MTWEPQPNKPAQTSRWLLTEGGNDAAMDAARIAVGSDAARNNCHPRAAHHKVTTKVVRDGPRCSEPEG